MADLESSLNRALFGQDIPTDVAGMVRELGGTRGAAEALGVTQRTVQRWTTSTAGQRRKPSTTTVGKLSTATRRKIAGPDRLRRLRGQGSNTVNKGEMGMEANKKSYMRDRRVTHELTPQRMQAVTTALIRGDTAKAAKSYATAFDHNYVSGFTFGDLEYITFD